ncbi:MAG: DNA-entry nuclease, partial [Clostridiales bacterium]|nr:DNA-entry nuclease [Clostridiales bacterium]
QPGIGIDYATGDSWSEPTEKADTETTYILNTNTKKFHYPSCSSVDQMKESNKQEYTGSRDDLINQGYDPCGRCNP